MHPILSELVEGLTLSGELSRDVDTFLRVHHCPVTAAHSADVAAEARRIAIDVGEDPARAEIAGWLHDVSAVFPTADRAKVAHQLGLDVLPEEESFPLIVHQKISVVMARDIFGVTDTAVLSAIGCHTTLRPDASRLDKVVFIADKIAWDRPSAPPYLPELRRALARSLDEGIRYYLGYLWQRRDSLLVIHPWLRASYEQSRRAARDS